MSTLVHADIFFFVTTIAVVVVAAVFTAALVYLVKILRDLKEVTAQVREETVLFREDLKGVRDEIRRDGFTLRGIFSILAKFFSGKERTSRSKNRK